MNNIIENLLIISAQASILIIAAMLFRLIYRKTYKVFTYIMWLIILFRLCVPIQIESPYGVFSFNQGRKTSESTDAIQSTENVKKENGWYGDLPSYTYQESTEGNITIISPTVQLESDDSAGSSVQNSYQDNNILFTKEQIVISVWIIGMTVILKSQLHR